MNNTGTVIPSGMYVEMNTHAHTTQSGIVISVEASPHITLPSGNTHLDCQHTGDKETDSLK